ncbi:MAG: hypothetical protein V1645_02215 [archaeon]
MKKRGKLEWEYIAAVVIILLIIIVMLLLSGTIKTIIWDKAKEAILGLLGQTGKP